MEPSIDFSVHPDGRHSAATSCQAFLVTNDKAVPLNCELKQIYLHRVALSGILSQQENYSVQCVKKT